MVTEINNTGGGNDSGSALTVIVVLLVLLVVGFIAWFGFYRVGNNSTPASTIQVNVPSSGSTAVPNSTSGTVTSTTTTIHY